jgi:hypothetical protein
MILVVGFEMQPIEVNNYFPKHIYILEIVLERESAIKILKDVLNQPVMGYDIPTKQQTVFKQPPVPPPIRTSSATRKLGRTRTHQQIPCEICEKELIKQHVWNLTR